MRYFVCIQIEAEPKILMTVQLENHFKKGTRFQELVADDVFKLGKDFKELIVSHLGISANIFEAIDNFSLEFN